jgi:RNA polymerase sigma-70 factor (ECF subfamily)
MEMPKLPINELAKACARSAHAAEWEEFLARCAPIAAIMAARVTRIWTGSVTPSIVDDIVQDVFLKLCDQERRILRDFKPRGEDSFQALLRTITASVANDYFRRRSSEKRGGKVVTISFDAEFPVAEPREQSAQHAVLFSELDRILRSAAGASAERDRTIFWLYYLQGLTAEEIAALPGLGLSAKGVESCLRRVVEWLRKQLHPCPPGANQQPAGETGC